ncbi:TetR/AcrR family transcriptional regulator [Paenibacillus sp. YPG26]|uniref:TetR/AcrR family transcriptional regulator n=1 Tax=Paenibacillus sp. YPG26 TaxID=2878915 RepID=UPI00203EB7FD|nr:TetR/AcrR family transcriptional regulator [Paenibacillus sp. YPG26]USB34623.1 TetR/AcrR family transcriptional regulator [Paenibacillus sp. YPG26]
MTPRTKEQNEAIRTRRMGQIMRAAAEAYVIKGINMDMRDVAAAADLGYGTVYHYYKNKYDLLSDLLTMALGEAEEIGLNYLIKGSSVQDYGMTLLRRWRKDPSLFVLYKLACEHFRELPEQEAKVFAERFRQSVIIPLAEVLGTLRRDSRLEESAFLIIGGLVGCAGLSVYRRSAEMNEDEIVKLLLGGF